MTRSHRPLLVVAAAAVALLLELTAAPAATAAPAFPPGQTGTATINATVFRPGSRVVVTVTNTTPGQLALYIQSVPVLLGTGSVGGRGNGVVRGNIPAGYSGAHTIQVTGAGGEVYLFPITVRTRAGG